MPIENLMLSRKCLASGSSLIQSLMSSGGVTVLASLIFPLRQQNPLDSCWNLFAKQSLQSSTGFSMCVTVGIVLYTMSYGYETLEIVAESSSTTSISTSSSSSSSAMVVNNMSPRKYPANDVKHQQITISSEHVTFIIFGIFFQYDTLVLTYHTIIHEHMFLK